MNTRTSIHAPEHWLVSSHLCNRERVDRASKAASQRGQPLLKYLVEQHKLDSLDMAMAAARAFCLPLLDLDAFEPLGLQQTVVDQQLADRHHVLPLGKQDGCLLLAVSDPANGSALEEIQFHTGCQVAQVVVEENKLDRALRVSRELTALSSPVVGPALMALDDHEVLAAEPGMGQVDSESVDETPVMRFLNQLLADAVDRKVSDIHLECLENCARVRFREDGLLCEVARPSLPVARKMASRLKVMAKLDIAEKRLPQDGRFRTRLSPSRAIDFRVSTLPTFWGEKTVIRLLDRKNQSLDLDALGFSGDQKQHYLDALRRQQGLILVTGPTGSGKSCSLYAGLQQLNTGERSIATAEDPVEIPLPGINQVAINPSAGLDFAGTLRAFLRQDPDVLMVGEIRDLETAEVAIRAAQTGHLVMSTLHTNDAPETLTRLLDMGIPAYQIATTVSLVIAQRLLRLLCHHCKKPLELPGKVLIEEGFPEQSIDEIHLFTAPGCDLCHKGYSGRTAVYETVPITQAISRVIMNGGNSIQIADISRNEGFNTLRFSALGLAAQGLTSLEEVNRISTNR